MSSTTILAVASKTNNALDMLHVLSYPVTEVPLCLAHCDGTALKTEKASLTKALEKRQEVVLVDANLPPITATVIDGGIILHETVLRHSKSTYATMARDLLVKVCSNRGEQIHLVLDKYQTPCIHQRCGAMLASFDFISSIHHYRARSSAAAKWHRVAEKWVMQRGVQPVHHEGMEKAPVRISPRKEIPVCFTWWILHADEKQ